MCIVFTFVFQNELFACRHWDINSVACIEDKCYVVTLAEYNRFCAKLRMAIEGIRPSRPYVPDPPETYPRKEAIPPHGADPESVFLCRQVYDFRQRRVLKNPL
ncbi:bromo adjacent homology domain-containing 1 protein-like [Diadema setosum]|uniref:bromo adjacent homology domain-containing 1 protein-like n=1 Tax=Diadema setosum TaxID=31175 RepID=UPI003B3B0E3F